MSETRFPQEVAPRDADEAADTEPSPALAGDAADLEAALRSAVAGDVRFDPGSRSMYAVDASNYRYVPVGVVAPRTTEDVEATVRVCREYEAPLLMRGGGTSLAGQCANAAVVLDTSRYLNRILELDPERRTARVQPGVVLDELRSAAEEHGLTFGPDPSTHAWCTMGGMIGNNACGVHSLMAGKTVDNIESLEVLTYDGQRMVVGPTGEEELERIIGEGGRRGEIYAGLKQIRDDHAERIRERFPDIPRRVSGYNLDELLPERGFHVARSLVGSEGTCATVLEATVRLVPSPPYRTLVLLGYPDVAAAGDHVAELRGYGPIGLEGMDSELAAVMRAKNLEPKGLKLLPEGRSWLFVEFGGWTQQEADDQAEALMADLRKRDDAPNMAVESDRRRANYVWEARAAGLGASARLVDGRETWEGWEDAAVPPEKLGDYLRDFRKLLDKFGYDSVLYGHFGQGLVHTRIDFDLETAEGIARYRKFVEEGAELVVSYGGSISGEHGDGQSRAELLPRMFGSELIDAFRRFKRVWDPDRRMNPGKLIDPYRLDEHMKRGPDYRLPRPSTNFTFPADDGSMARATSRCIGVGKCRRLGGGTMCPSYMATKEEKHTTRGRAHLLHDMLEGRLPDGWRNQNVKEALDLCLACKGCKSDCPAGVDIATYKAEFLSHYYKGRVRPRQAYAFGLIDKWARLASAVPGATRLANAVMQTPGLGRLAKAAAGMAPQRSAPRFADRTFKRWFRDRGAPTDETADGNRGGDGGNRGGGGGDARPTVVLWADTFNNHFHPEVAQDAVTVLEAAGYRVKVPEASLCCGRPLYDYGMLGRAERLLRQTLDVLGPDLEAGRLVVGLEPSCVAVFRDEAVNLLGNEEAVRRLRDQTVTLAEFLRNHADGYEPPRRPGANHGTGNAAGTEAEQAAGQVAGQVAGEVAGAERVLFHGHCHQKAVLTTEPDVALLEAMGYEVQTPTTGCCGMAGSFGFESGHYDVSMRIGERVLLPAAREADERTLIVTDGFSCREQLARGTGREARHLAQILAAGHRAQHGEPTPASG